MRYISHPLAIIIFTLLSGLFSLSLYSGLQRTRVSSEQVGVLEQEIAQIASEVSGLEKQVQLASSSAAQEKIIRDELLMQKPGEIVVQMPSLTTTPEPVITTSSEVTPWQQWLELLF